MTRVYCALVSSKKSMLDQGGNALKANTPEALGLMRLNGNGDSYQMVAVVGV